jgi:hypothetical protein
MVHTHEKIVGVGVGATNLEKLHEVVELAVDVAADGDGAFHRLNVGFFLQDFARLVAQSLDISLGQLLALHQALDPPIQRGNGGGLGRDRRYVGRHPSHVLHIGIHTGRRGVGSRRLCGGKRGRWVFAGADEKRAR